MIDIEKLVKQITEQVLKEILESKLKVGESISSKLEKPSYTPPAVGKKILITKDEVLKAYKSQTNIEVPAGSIITPLAYDLAKEKNVKIIIKNEIILGEYKSKIPQKIEKIGIASDHGGFKLKEKLKDYLHTLGYVYEDFGTHSTESVDYPDFAKAVAKAVANSECDKGIVIDGAGIGSAITANKIKGILAAVCHDRFTARIAREHDNANILALGANVVNEFQAKEIVRIFLTTPFAGGRHARRIEKIFKIENEN
jgi:ribose 5-phosphate isomerase B